MKIKLLLACAALAAGAQAHADSLSFTSMTGTKFNDTFSFELTDPSSVSAIGTLLTGSGMFTASLYETVGTSTNSLGSFVFGGDAVSSGTKSYANLSTGDYFFTVKGTGSPAKYSFTASTLAVPEPETYAMALLGLVAVGGGLRMRKKTTEAA